MRRAAAFSNMVMITDARFLYDKCQGVETWLCEPDPGLVSAGWGMFALQIE